MQFHSHIINCIASHDTLSTWGDLNDQDKRIIANNFGNIRLNLAHMGHNTVPNFNGQNIFFELGPHLWGHGYEVNRTMISNTTRLSDFANYAGVLSNLT